MRLEGFIVSMIPISLLLISAAFAYKFVTTPLPSELQATFVFAKDAQGNCFERVDNDFKAVSCKESSHAEN